MSQDFGLIRCQHAGIHVRDLDETTRWYGDILGFVPIPTPDSSQFGGCFPPSRLLKKGDFYLELYETPYAKPFDWVDLEWKLGVKHLSFSVEKLDELMEMIRARGDVKILVDNEYTEATCGVPGGDRAVYLLDCNGILLELSKVHNRG